MAEAEETTGVVDLEANEPTASAIFDDPQLPAELKPKADDRKAGQEPAKGDDKAKEEGQQRQWDKDRQARDQARAERETAERAEDRRMIQEVVAQNAELAKAIIALGGKAPAKVEEEADPLDKLGEDATAEDLLKALKASKARDRELMQDLLKQNKQLQEELKNTGKRVDQHDESEFQRRGTEALNTTFARCEEKYGPGFRNDVHKEVREMFAGLKDDEGNVYSESNPPPLRWAQREIEAAYARLAEANPNRRTAPILDNGAGGAPKGTEIKAGSLKSVLQQMRST